MKLKDVFVWIIRKFTGRGRHEVKVENLNISIYIANRDLEVQIIKAILILE